MENIFASHSRCINHVLSSISIKYQNKKKLLDIGCGDGARTSLFDEYERVIYGLDRMNWLNQSAAQRIIFQQQDFMRFRLPYDDAMFDIIFSFDVIEHLANPGSLLPEIRRVLKNDGVFIIGTPNRNRLFGFFLQLFGLRKFPYHPNPDNIETDPYSAHIMEYTPAGLRVLLRGEGLEITKIHKVFYGLSSGFGIRSFFSLPLFHNIICECIKK